MRILCGLFLIGCLGPVRDLHAQEKTPPVARPTPEKKTPSSSDSPSSGAPKTPPARDGKTPVAPASNGKSEGLHKYKVIIDLDKGDKLLGRWTDGQRVVFDLASPSGTSTAVIERLQDQWPKLVVVYLHLKTLDNFRVQTASKKLRLTTKALPDGKLGVIQYRMEKEKIRIHKEDPMWVNVSPMDKEGKAATRFPLEEGGYFELTMPAALFENNPKSFRIHWVDSFNR